MRRQMISRFFVALVYFFVIAPTEAAVMTFESGRLQVKLLELFTSQSCSSCPPADDWLSKVGRYHHGSFVSFVPIAFHVDYWNDLGWQDIFSSPEYSLRQRRLVKTWKRPSVYTPSVMLNGQELKGYSIPLPSNIKVGKLSVKINPDRKISVSFYPEDKAKHDYHVNIALLVMNARHKIESGENKGKTLVHDFAACDLKKKRLKRRSARLYVGTFLGIQCQRNRFRQLPKAFASWVEKSGSLVPVQATGGILKN